jgi:hypothetical protein
VDRIPFCYSSTFVVNNRTTGAEQDHRSGTGADKVWNVCAKKWETMQPPYMQKVRDELRVYFNV